MKDSLLEQRDNDFAAVRLTIASPEQILDWSHGEVTKPETINYRTQKPEKDGLFCERIFGPTKDWECYCGKYKRIRYKDVVCDKCGVRVTRSIVRRERMGHISLAVPVAHTWFLRGTPSTVGLLMNLSVKDLERVVYFASYLVTEVNEDARKAALEMLQNEYTTRRKELEKNHKTKEAEGETDAKTFAAEVEKELADLEANYSTIRAELEGLAKLQLLTESKYRELNLKHGDVFKAGIGAEAVRDLLGEIDMDQMTQELAKEAEDSQGQKKKKALKRLKLLEGMKSAGIHPEWMIIQHLPVIPPDLRPMVQLPGGRFAASDLNDLYRRVINRNNRLKRLIELDAPEVIRRNEKRMLQEAVDALIDNNARRERAVSSTGSRRKLKSLSDMLKGKQGRFRQNLLGKRVDYSGRSVIVSGPFLKLHQAGLPKMMALELFKPFVIGRLIEEGHAHNVRSASRMIERGRNEVWDMLEEIIKDKYVLLNRAPTLHRLGIQAFQPVLREGKAIQLHPLVCAAFNADFDGDQMAVHVPLSRAAQREAKEIMLSSKNLLKPADGSPVINPSQDMVLGCYYLTYDKFPQEEDTVHHYSSHSEVIMAFERGHLKLQSWVKAPVAGEIVTTTVGRLLFNEIMPEGFAFQNVTLTKKVLQRIVAQIFVAYGRDATAKLVDDIKDLGFRYSTYSGISIGVDDFTIPENKPALLEEAENKAIEISRQFEIGLITEEERYQRTVDVWKRANQLITQSLEEALKFKTSSANIFVDSGARGDLSQINQIAGMLGMVADPSGRTIELPIRSNYKEGFSVLEYFNSTHGARKGLTDTALRTAESGYLTRRLVDVAQDVFVTEEDCGDKEGAVLSRADSDSMGESFAYRLAGRFAAKDIKDDKGNVVVKRGHIIGDEAAVQITESKTSEVYIRSALKCHSNWGICQKCYGADLARGQVIELGEPVGVIAAQSIGEPGTQLTMRTFHKGAVAGEDITQGLPRVEEIFEARNPKGEAALADVEGIATVKTGHGKHTIRLAPIDVKITEFSLEGMDPKVKSGDKVLAGDVLAVAQTGKKQLKAKAEGTVEVKREKILFSHTGAGAREYSVPDYQALLIKNGDKVQVGQRMTEGSINLQDMLRLLGQGAVHDYIISEVQTIYASQGATIADKHLEVIIRQMFSRVQIEEPGDSLYVTGEIVSKTGVMEENAELEAAGKRPATYEQLLLGVTKISTSSDSFLSAASFQDTTRVLINAAVRGKLDKLRGLKENVIIGRLIPVGTGFKGHRFQAEEEVAQPVVAAVAAEEVGDQPEVDPEA